MQVKWVTGVVLPSLDDLVEDFEVLADVGAAGAVGTGDVVGVQRVQLFEDAALTAQLFHADIRLGREHLERESGSVFIDFSNAHICLQKI